VVRDPQQQAAHEVRDDGRRPRRRTVANQIVAQRGDANAVGGRVGRGGGERRRVVVDAGDGVEAELRGGDREHARAAAEVDESAARTELEQQLEA